MTPEGFQYQQAFVYGWVAAQVLALIRPFRNRVITPFQWEDILRTLFPVVREGHSEMALAARKLYDAEQQRHFPGSERDDIELAEYAYDGFRQSMFPAWQELHHRDSTDGQLQMMALRTLKEVARGSRDTLIDAIEEPSRDDRGQDPSLSPPRSTKLVKGWARVATGRETCAWCLMLISRGPVYSDAQSAGFDVDDETAIEIFDRIKVGDPNASAEMRELMTRWHPNCDCMVVPVFDRRDWPGREQYKRAEQLWIDHGKANPGLRGRELYNSFRRMVENGDAVNFEDYSLAL